MGYAAGLLNKRVQVAMRAEAETDKFGVGGSGNRYYIAGTYWAGKQFNKGAKSLREGAVAAYDVVIFRFRFHKDIDRWSLIKCQGKWYQIESFNDDYQDNIIQITARELENQDVTIVDGPTPDPSTSEI